MVSVRLKPMCRGFRWNMGQSVAPLRMTGRVNSARTSRIRRIVASFLGSESCRTERPNSRLSIPVPSLVTKMSKFSLSFEAKPLVGRYQLRNLKVGNPQSFCVQTNSHSARMTKIALISLRLKALKFVVWLGKCTTEGVPPHLPRAMHMEFSLGELS